VSRPPNPGQEGFAGGDLGTIPQQPGSACAADEARILVADDQPEILEALRLLLKSEGYQFELVDSPKAVLERLRARTFDALLLDLNYTRDTTSGREGLDLLSCVQAVDPTLPIIVMTAWATIPLAVEAMRQGVRDFVQKPWDNGQILNTLREQIRWVRLERRRQQVEQEEWHQAREIEQQLLPREAPPIPGYEISVLWEPASAVGGDYFDIQKLGEDTIALSIGDVVGRGVPAALLMSNLQAVVRACIAESGSPDELCSMVNQVVCGNVTPDRFITFFFGLLDVGDGRLVYTNAGHNAPIVVRRSGSRERLSAGGTVLGFARDSRYARGSLVLATGDFAVLFTDGLTEAARDDGEEFGEERLLNLLAESGDLSANDLRNKIAETITMFTGSGFRDDATLVVLKRKP
jgi:sigma-B regulation protein RsbU (phosphoserine phosphatase)